jgi:hypothetical protein
MATCDGDWNITAETPMGTQNLTLTLVSDGQSLTGSADTPMGTQAFENGSVDGDQLAWKVKVRKPMPMTLRFKATVAGDTIDGTVAAGPLGESPFHGTRN